MNKKEVILSLLQSKYTLGSAESLTGGKFAATITSFSGVSKFFLGGIVSYSNNVKMQVLKVKKETLDQFGAVSKETAKEMAEGAKNLLHSDITVSFTGNAGPSVLEGKEKGLVYIGFLFQSELHLYELHLNGSREEIQNACIEFAFEKIYNFLERKEIKSSIVSLEV